ncbi:hypothetical protein [Suttonella ornithocola]|uniref:hypothetical protein n=1 Tax=Suttonella ornithocola TaxID=279832 RepID=UPI0011C04CEB|nr:hypothetical protein [Suttonella ornithocola]
MATLLGTTQSTISRRLGVLRALRLITLLPQVKQNLRGKQKITVHSEQQSLSSILQLDNDYLVFLSDSTKKGTQRLRQICREELYAIPSETLLEYNIVLAINADETAFKSVAGIKNESSHLLGKTETESGSLSCPHSVAVNKYTHMRVMHEQVPVMQPCITRDLRGYIYNRAPAQIGINIINDIYNTTIHTREGGMEGGKKKILNNHEIESQELTAPVKTSESPFAYLYDYDHPISKLISRLEEKYGKKTTHAILGCIKQGHYHHAEETFTYRACADDIAMIVMALIDGEIGNPIAYTTTLLYRASQNMLTYRGDQYRRYLDWTGQLKQIHAEKVQKKQAKQAEEAKKLAQIELKVGMLLQGKSGTKYPIEFDNAIGSTTNVDGLRIGVNSFDDAKRAIISGLLTIVEKSL